MNDRNSDLKDLFCRLFRERTVLLGVGNVLRGDDAFGPAFAEAVKGIGGIQCFDGGSAPENYLGKIVKERPDNVLIADAAHLELAPGEYDLLMKDQIASAGLSTHDLSPAMFMELLESQTDARVYMLAVQPSTMEFGADMSPQVKRTLSELINLAREAKDA